MKILVLCVMKSSRHRKCLFGAVFTSCLCQKPSLARTSLVRVFTPLTVTPEHKPVRHTFYDVNYIYIYICICAFVAAILPMTYLVYFWLDTRRLLCKIAESHEAVFWRAAIGINTIISCQTRRRGKNALLRCSSGE